MLPVGIYGYNAWRFAYIATRRSSRNRISFVTVAVLLLFGAHIKMQHDLSRHEVDVVPVSVSFGYTNIYVHTDAAAKYEFVHEFLP